MHPEIQPTRKTRQEIIRDFEDDPYLIMKALYTLAPVYYDRQHSKYS